MNVLKSFFVLMAIALFIFACTDNKPVNSNSTNAASVNTNTTTNTQTNAPANTVADARKMYADKCAKCHKEDGKGGKVDFDGETFDAEDFTTDKMAKMADEKYFEYIKNGVPGEGMPAFKDQLTDEQIQEVIKFIRTEFQKK